MLVVNVQLKKWRKWKSQWAGRSLEGLRWMIDGGSRKIDPNKLSTYLKKKAAKDVSFSCPHTRTHTCAVTI